MMIPACFSQSTTTSNQTPPQNVVTCIYQTQLFNSSSSSTYLTLSWSKTPFSHSLTIYAADIFTTTISLNPSTFSFFRSPHGSKSIYYHQNHRRHKIKLQWNFSRTKFTQKSAEPDSCFYLAILCNGKIKFFIGDINYNILHNTQEKSVDPILLSRREHVFGSKSYVSRAVFMGCKHDIEIECSGGSLRVKVDSQLRLVVKRLAWKFRGNDKFFVDGVEVEFYWDVLSWVANGDNNENSNSSNGGRHGVFVFQVGGDGTVWPEMVGAEKKLMKKGLLPGSGVLQWAEETSDGGRTSSSSSARSSASNGGAFSLLLYAWPKN
ncbi:hypothetical protein HN51_039673 [Arachis hypogaea]|uniref:Uncharacterized protein n=1 Tax=Arachis hypogaea TaxID=3818 RepID=A0A444YKH8_ARAHY|nr:uncharacterized protein LOC112758243 [Arachis hypogaea]QHN85264.1 uncharacterized protein DS421_16g535860 [Arachis hypogaea]RYR02379.1 hypothetical protein Ahy_B06g081175 [Arachis hypogaea]